MTAIFYFLVVASKNSEKLTGMCCWAKTYFALNLLQEKEVTIFVSLDYFQFWKSQDFNVTQENGSTIFSLKFRCPRNKNSSHNK